MKTRPILFSGAMVRAILAGTKTQTRRIIKPQPNGRIFLKYGCWNSVNELTPWVCPYGQPGDRLWVRETWGFRGRSFAYNVDGKPGRRPFDEFFIQYQADGTKKTFKRPVDDESGVPKHKPGMNNDELEKWWAQWRPSIHMPRWASRIPLEIVSVRVERLQDISEADALAEGVEPPFPNDPLSQTAVDNYRNLWESINGPGSWEKNPWVWVVGFRPAPSGEGGKPT